MTEHPCQDTAGWGGKLLITPMKWTLSCSSVVLHVLVCVTLACSVVKGTGFPGGSVVKNLPANAGDARDADSVPGSVRSPGLGIGNLLQYSCLENSMGRGAWWATVQGVTKGQTPLSTHTHSQSECECACLCVCVRVSSPFPTR